MQLKSKLLVSLAGAALFLAVGTIAQVRSTPTTSVVFNPTFSFGMIGLGPADTARLNVVNLIRTAVPLGIAVVPCKVELDLYDGQGTRVMQKIIANLGIGQADFVDVPRSAVATAGTHVEVSGVVKVESPQSFFCEISPTLEVYDSVTGATAVILAGASAQLPVALSALTPNAQP
jgi:hypothetical protein